MKAIPSPRSAAAFVLLSLGLAVAPSVQAPEALGAEEPWEHPDPSEWFWVEPPLQEDFVVAAEPRTVHEVWIEGSAERLPLIVPPASKVRIDVVRLDGAAPRVLSIRNGEGEPLRLRTLRSNSRRVRLAPIATGFTPGLELVLTSEDGEPARYDVVIQIEEAGEWFEEPEIVREFEHGQVVVEADPYGPAWERLEDFELETLAQERGLGVVYTEGGYGSAAFYEARWLQFILAGMACCEPDPMARLPEGSQINHIIRGSQFGRQYEKQRALRTIRARPAHRRATGAGVIVAVLDTGIDFGHPLFEGKLEPGFDLVDPGTPPIDEANGIDDDGDGEVDEGYGHGTMTAGVVLAAAPEARILPIRVLDSDGRGSASRVAAGIYRAVDEGARVINLSLGTSTFSASLSEAVRYAYNRGVILVAAAGNDGEADQVDFPGNDPFVISVSALRADGRRARFANGRRGNSVAAPGSDVIGPMPVGTWGKGSGTSFAAALVSGGAALLVERRPGHRAKTLKRVLTRRWKIDLRRLVR